MARLSAAERHYRFRMNNKIPHPQAKKAWEFWTQGAVFGSILMIAGHFPFAHPTVLLVAMTVCTILLVVFLPPELWAAIWAPDWTYSWTVSEWPFFARWSAAVVLPVVGGRTITLWPIRSGWWNHIVWSVDSGPLHGVSVTVGVLVGIGVWFILAAWLIGHFLSKMRIV